MTPVKWLPFVQWGFIGLMSGAAIFDAWRDPSISLLIDGFCIGITLMSMIASKLFEHQAQMIAYQDMVIRAMMRDFEKAVETGTFKVEVGPRMIIEDEPDKPILH